MVEQMFSFDPFSSALRYKVSAMLIWGGLRSDTAINCMLSSPMLLVRIISLVHQSRTNQVLMITLLSPQPSSSISEYEYEKSHKVPVNPDGTPDPT